MTQYEEAIRFLRQSQPAPPLKRNALLERAASDHRQDIGPKGLLSHKGSDGSSYKERIERHCKWGGAIFQMIDYTERESPKDAILAFLVDDGVPNRTNRTKLLDPALTEIGIACGGHKATGHCSVLVFAAQVVDFQKYSEMTAPAEPKQVKLEWSKFA